MLAAIAAAGLGVVIWLLALGGADTIGLRNEDDAESGAVLATATRTQTPPASLEPLGYKAADCDFQVPEGTTPECGYLTVPQSRSEPDRGTVRLPVAVFKTASGAPRSDPIIYLDGGPGGDTQEGIEFLYPALEPLAADRDLIIFDQRGAGGSIPSLACPELTNIDFDHLLRRFTIEERVAQDAASTRSCYERLTDAGIDPTFATSAESAADVNDLRLALGYDQWNLYGVSYGTKLALTVMRDYPEGVRSAILDSVYPLQSDLPAELQADFDRALGAVFEACAADPQCNQSYPDLEEVFYETVDRLDEVPVQFAIGALSGRPIETATIDGVLFSAFIFQSLYSEQLIPLLPRVIFDTRDHDYDILEILAEAYLQDAERISQGMYLSVQCGEEAPFSDRDAIIAAARAHPRLPGYAEYAAQSTFATCDEWHAPPASAEENQAVQSSIPALVLAGEFDPITPPAWGRLAGEGLENSFFFEFPGLGHGIAVSGGCPAQMTLAFLDDPRQEPSRGCIANMTESDWLLFHG